MADSETHGLKTPPRKTRRVLRLIGWNLLLTLAGLALIALTGEVYLRLKRSMMSFYINRYPLHFVSKVGLMLEPNAEVRSIDHREFWTISRTNSLGFLDREPIGSNRAAESCHIAMIGDSFVEATDVPIADKFYVRLEELAARQLPHLDITTSAFGKGGTGQINQLPLYDEFARRLSPKLVVLVFVDNDFRNNSPFFAALSWKVHPDRQPFVTATRDENGAIKLRPPHPDWQGFRSQAPPDRRLAEDQHVRSYFVQGLRYNISAWFPSQPSYLPNWVKLLSDHPAYESQFNGWQPKTRAEIHQQFEKKTLLPAFEKELAFTAFALDQFKERTDRDEASLVILASYTMGTRGHGPFDHMSALSEVRGIPVIDQYDYILRQGADPERDATWANDWHWNVAGHQWAAEALLEYLKENPEICTQEKTP